jgi:hypothetical protein
LQKAQGPLLFTQRKKKKRRGKKTFLFFFPGEVKKMPNKISMKRRHGGIFIKKINIKPKGSFKGYFTWFLFPSFHTPLKDRKKLTQEGKILKKGGRKKGKRKKAA